MAGVHEGCRQAGCALLGGETAEHAGVMAPDELDLAGFAVGVVEQGAQLGPERVRAGDVVVGLPSPGLRSNGYTLARHVLLERAGLDLDDPAWAGADHSAGRRAAAPVGDLRTRPCSAARGRARATRCTPCAHVTGGGIVGNLPRVLPERPRRAARPVGWDEPRVFVEIQRLGAVAEDEMDRVFNRGIGMALVVDAAGADDVARALDRDGRPVAVIGEVVDGARACGSRERSRPVRRACATTCWSTRSSEGTSRSSRAARAAGSSTRSRRCAGPRPCCSSPTPCSRSLPADATAIGGLDHGGRPGGLRDGRGGGHAGPAAQGVQRPQGGEGPRRRRSDRRRPRSRRPGRASPRTR